MARPIPVFTSFRGGSGNGKIEPKLKDDLPFISRCCLINEVPPACLAPTSMSGFTWLAKWDVALEGGMSAEQLNLEAKEVK